MPPEAAALKAFVRPGGCQCCQPQTPARTPPQPQAPTPVRAPTQFVQHSLWRQNKQAQSVCAEHNAQRQTGRRHWSVVVDADDDDDVAGQDQKQNRERKEQAGGSSKVAPLPLSAIPFGGVAGVCFCHSACGLSMHFPVCVCRGWLCVCVWCTLWAKYLWHKVWFSIMQSPKSNKMRLQKARTKVCNTLRRSFCHFRALSHCLSHSLSLFRIQTLWIFNALLPLQLNFNFHLNKMRKNRSFDAGLRLFCSLKPWGVTQKFYFCVSLSIIYDPLRNIK